MRLTRKARVATEEMRVVSTIWVRHTRKRAARLNHAAHSALFSPLVAIGSVMETLVCDVRENLQVFDRVVQPVMILMMYVFISPQWSPKMPLHYQPVLAEAASVDYHDPIAILGMPFAWSIAFFVSRIAVHEQSSIVLRAQATRLRNLIAFFDRAGAWLRMPYQMNATVRPQAGIMTFTHTFAVMWALTVFNGTEFVNGRRSAIVRLSHRTETILSAMWLGPTRCATTGSACFAL